MKQIIDNEALVESFSTPAENSPDEHSSLFLTDSHVLSPDEYRPPPAHAICLWQLFLDRVNPLIKIIHVPTVQPMLVEFTTNPADVPRNAEAILFSIYLLAAISMTDAECQSSLGYTKKAAIGRFTRGARAALTCLDVLKSRDFVVLQAMTLYLVMPSFQILSCCYAVLICF